MEDPFEAKKVVDSRQSKKREQVERQAEFKRAIGGDFSTAASSSSAQGQVNGKGKEVDRVREGGKGWSGVPEVKMTVAQREVVEGVVKKVSRTGTRGEFH
jgi:hypothetical protein